MFGANDIEQLRTFILAIIDERTMPREFSAPDDMWLMPWYRIVEDRQAIADQLSHLNEEVRQLRQRIADLEQGRS